MMKNLLLFLSFFPCVFFSVHAQEAQVALFHYTVNLSDEFQSEIFTWEDMAEVFKDMKDGRPHYLEYVMEPYYTDLVESLEKKTDLTFLPAESLGDRVMYWNGFPMGTKNQAIKSVEADYYARLELLINAPSSSTTTTGIGPVKKEKKKVRPAVVANLVLFNGAGKKVGKYKSKAKSEEKVELSRKVFNNWFRLEDDKNLADNKNVTILDKVVYEAIDGLVAQIAALEF